MARSIFACFLLFVALLVGVTSSSAQSVGTGITVNGLPVTQLNVTGRIVCSPVGFPLQGYRNAPVVGVNVTLSCDGGVTKVGQATTNSMGVFQITVNTTSINPINLGNCLVDVPKPPNSNCVYLSDKGSFQIPLTMTGLDQAPAGYVMTFRAGLGLLNL